MSALYFLIPMSLLVLAAAIAMFVWSLRKGQYDDLQGPAHRIIFDEREDQVRRDRQE